MDEIIEELRQRTGDSEGHFPNGLQIKNGKGITRYNMPFRYRKTKGDGTKTQKVYEIPVLIKYDPFTGEKLNS